MYRGEFTAQIGILIEIPDEAKNEYKPFDELQALWVDELGLKLEKTISNNLLEDKDYVKICQVSDIDASFEKVEGDDSNKKRGELQVSQEGQEQE